MNSNSNNKAQTSSDAVDSQPLASIEHLQKHFLSEILSTAEEYQRLQIQNNLTRERYMKLSTVAQSLIQQAASMADQPISLSMYSDQLTEVEARIIYLEQIAQELDAYTKELEIKCVSMGTKVAQSNNSSASLPF